jgi:hypothetical protein
MKEVVQSAAAAEASAAGTLCQAGQTNGVMTRRAARVESSNVEVRMVRKLVWMVMVAVLAGGCYLTKADARDVYEAEQRGDYQFVEDVCSGKKAALNGRDEACVISSERKALGPPGEPDCATVVARYQSVPRGRPAFIYAMAKQMAACRDAVAVFHHVAPMERGPEYIAKLESDGFEMDAAFTAYLGAFRGPAFMKTRYGQDALVHVIDWLLRSKHLSHCDGFLSALEGASEIPTNISLRYLGVAKCHGAVPLFERALSSSNPSARILACEGLGAVGEPTASTINLTKNIARFDGYTERGEGDTSRAEALEEESAEAFADGDDEESADLDEEAADAYEAAANSGPILYPVRDACSDATRQLIARARLVPATARTPAPAPAPAPKPAKAPRTKRKR